MRRALFIFALCMTAAASSTAPLQAADAQKIAIVNFKKCLEESKIGKDEGAKIQSMKNELQAALEAKEKELNDLAPKFNQEYLDTLTPEAENELKNKFRALSQELSENQNQFYQMLNQAHMQVMQRISEMVEKASTKIANDKNFDIVLNDEASFFYKSACDISKEVIAELDVIYKQDKEKVAKEQEKQAQKK